MVQRPRSTSWQVDWTSIGARNDPNQAFPRAPADARPLGRTVPSARHSRRAPCCDTRPAPRWRRACSGDARPRSSTRRRAGDSGPRVRATQRGGLPPGFAWSGHLRCGDAPRRLVRASHSRLLVAQAPSLGHALGARRISCQRPLPRGGAGAGEAISPLHARSRPVPASSLGAADGATGASIRRPALPGRGRSRIPSAA